MLVNLAMRQSNIPAKLRFTPTRTNFNSFIKMLWIIRSCITLEGWLSPEISLVYSPYIWPVIGHQGQGATRGILGAGVIGLISSLIWITELTDIHKICSSTFNLNSFNQNKNTCSTLNSDNFSVRENTLFVCDFDLSAQW